MVFVVFISSVEIALAILRLDFDVSPHLITVSWLSPNQSDPQKPEFVENDKVLLISKLKNCQHFKNLFHWDCASKYCGDSLWSQNSHLKSFSLSVPHVHIGVTDSWLRRAALLGEHWFRGVVWTQPAWTCPPAATPLSASFCLAGAQELWSENQAPTSHLTWNYTLDSASSISTPQLPGLWRSSILVANICAPLNPY